MRQVTLKTVMNCGNSLVCFTMPYMSLAYALKLDGYVDLPWVIMLAPVWFPLALFIWLFLVCLIMLAIRNLLEFILKHARKL